MVKRVARADVEARQCRKCGEPLKKVACRNGCDCCTARPAGTDQGGYYTRGQHFYSESAREFSS